MNSLFGLRKNEKAPTIEVIWIFLGAAALILLTLLYFSRIVSEPYWSSKADYAEFFTYVMEDQQKLDDYLPVLRRLSTTFYVVFFSCLLVLSGVLAFYGNSLWNKDRKRSFLFYSMFASSAVIFIGGIFINLNKYTGTECSYPVEDIFGVYENILIVLGTFIFCLLIFSFRKFYLSISKPTFYFVLIFTFLLFAGIGMGVFKNPEILNENVVVRNKLVKYRFRNRFRVIRSSDFRVRHYIKTENNGEMGVTPDMFDCISEGDAINVSVTESGEVRSLVRP